MIGVRGSSPPRWYGTPRSPARIASGALLGAPGALLGYSEALWGSLGAARWFLDAPWALIRWLREHRCAYIRVDSVSLRFFNDFRYVFVDFSVYSIFSLGSLSISCSLSLFFSLASLVWSLSFERPATHHSPQLHRGGAGDPPDHPDHTMGGGGEGPAAQYIYIYSYVFLYSFMHIYIEIYQKKQCLTQKSKKSKKLTKKKYPKKHT